MKDFRSHTRIEARATIEFSEGELRALDALIGYGADSFLEVFYSKLGKAYMEPWEPHLRSLFKRLAGPVRGSLSEVDQARRLLQQAGSGKPRRVA